MPNTVIPVTEFDAYDTATRRVGAQEDTMGKSRTNVSRKGARLAVAGLPVEIQHVRPLETGPGPIAYTPPAPRDPWAHRSAGMRCGTCMWFAEKVAAEGGRATVGRCRRHAPTMQGYPVVFRTDWCGDHKLDETKVGEA